MRMFDNTMRIADNTIHIVEIIVGNADNKMRIFDNTVYIADKTFCILIVRLRYLIQIFVRIANLLYKLYSKTTSILNLKAKSTTTAEDIL